MHFGQGREQFTTRAQLGRCLLLELSSVVVASKSESLDITQLAKKKVNAVKDRGEMASLAHA